MEYNFDSRVLASATKEMVGESVVVSGWVASVRDHGQLLFIDLRDWSGRVQVVVNPDNKEVFEVAKDLANEFVIYVEGKVVERKGDLVNENIETGSVEIETTKLEILSKSKPAPFPVEGDGRDIDENTRFKYRYVDLRRDRMKKIIKQRADYLLAVRNWMAAKGFTDVTTPLLTSSSPEGARDYMVPSRLHQGKFFVLPQAPQQYKQLLMVGGIDKYFQIAPCARDEDPRADRHAGIFYQIDMEMSFPTIEKIFATAENLIKDTYKVVAPHKELKDFPFPRIKYEDSMNIYGTDKPDIRFEMKLKELTDVVKDKTDFNIFNSAESVKAIVVEGKAEWSRTEIAEVEDFAKQHGAKGLAFVKVVDGKLDGGVSKFLVEVTDELLEATGAKNGDLIYFGAGERKEVNKILGKVRSHLGKELGLYDENELALAWVTDFPFYEETDDGRIDFGHNPFSMPKGGIEAFDVDDPLEIETFQYDLAINGYEILSGSIRNHDPEILVKAFETVGYDREEVESRFGALYKAFQFGVPPHGGWAIGIDRYFMVLVDEPNIRDVYAFPKNSNGVDMLMNAPNTPKEEDLDILGIETKFKGGKVADQIVEMFEENDYEYEYMEHEPVRTSEQAAKVRGCKVSDGAKSMILKSKSFMNKYISVVIPADKQLSIDKVNDLLGDQFELASEEDIHKQLGLIVGGVPPMCRLLGLEVYYDKSMYEKEKSAFNIGTKERSIIANTEDLIKLAQPNEISKDADFLL